MKYLANHLLVHRNLAARTCLVNDKNNVKISGFCLARDMVEIEVDADNVYLAVEVIIFVSTLHRL